jgi:hypothetical protein
MTTKATHPKRKTPTERQRKYRERLKREGYQRIELNIPPELWAELEPLLAGYYHGRTHPGHGMVRLLWGLFRDPRHR